MNFGKNSYQSFVISIIISFIILGSLFFNWKFWIENKNNKILIKEQEKKISILQSINKKILVSKIGLKKELEDQLLLVQKQVDEWKDKYKEKKKILDNIEDSFEGLTKSIKTIEKIQNTDKELLAKYSKVYFLNEHFIPKKIKDIDGKYLYNKKTILQLQEKIIEYIEDMIDNAKDDKKELKIVSAYRSYTTQKNLKKRYIQIYGQKNADTFSANQGLSEHQLGTTVDFINTKTGKLKGYQDTDEYKWLIKNAYKYGFILSYSADNQYYQFEPWHWRFVGKKLSKYLHRHNKMFYELSQREINKYLEYFYD